MSNATTYVMLALLVVLIFFMFRNRRKRAAEQQNLQSKLVPGVEVMLTFGLYGTIVSINDDENIAEVEVAPGTIIRVHRQTLGRVVEPVVAVDEPTVADASSASYSLNKDSAIPATDPSYGERLDQTPTTDDDTKH
ncbi:preprotein translocase subunit YajC [Frondihabitans sp. PhB188]|uniref:preprotein translocase subunit YajC n=1 Tax=Frondihabitans sp. PhB188 TaxID=2485200 RepID=UPI000F4A2D10|nr:preprotein translocase subunit YajC [Frondihabitans sp. PhB188]ROQ41062.1 preprotein translocase subunit YajC [Frondihabitans sp. PhB188]